LYHTIENVNVEELKACIPDANIVSMMLLGMYVQSKTVDSMAQDNHRFRVFTFFSNSGTNHL